MVRNLRLDMGTRVRRLFLQSVAVATGWALFITWSSDQEWSTPKEKTIVVWNKCDIGVQCTDGIKISALHGTGLEDLQKASLDHVWKKGAPEKAEVLITQLRHYEALSSAIQSCDAVICGLQSGVSAEFTAADMRSALNSLGTIIGTNVTEDILSAIFSKFCLGK